MKKTLFILYVLIPIMGFADVPRFDVAQLKINDSIVYMRYESKGLLKNGDFCYYDYQNEYQGEVKHEVYKLLKDPRNHDFYRELHRIDARYFPEIFYDSRGTLFVLKGEIKIQELNIDEVEILSVQNGNTYGFTYSEDLNGKDNDWLTKYKIEKLIEFHDDGLCHMYLYAIEGAVSAQRKKALKWLMDDIANDGSPKFNEELHRLYKQKIIMIGFCSC